MELILNERKLLGALPATLGRSDLNFKFDILEKATKFFNDSTKLGQGGFGSVHRGTLPDGTLVAVKRLIFCRNIVHRLSWKERCNVILGTAEGLLHLHEDSGLQIIHGDIKLSNILLDENFTAKIADIGLARLFFSENMTRVSTTIAGTIGCIAPEYALSGKLTEKADVYSYGVLVIEVLCGQKINSFYQDSSVLQTVTPALL
ncbi:hypothetical protein IFM89_007158 [Coptis chinensis]|uniref:non-specific serine/threonine protein kinase n=1 Tax=Coptis chinensis TaxID=261450 RepID=A0A835H9C0_9MAGN|nr:hypothetical protein IFM89_007158 [Coptis chinensis]